MLESNHPLVFPTPDSAPPPRLTRLPTLDDPAVAAVVHDIERAVMHRPGMKCARLLRVRPPFFAGLQEECLELTRKKMTAALRDNTRIENWIGHYGVTAQTRIDKMMARGKLDPARFPHFCRLLGAFPNALEIKINGLAENSGLSHHEEPLILWHEKEKKHYLQLRFHLPLHTNAGAEMQLAGEAFHFAAGEIYFFNKGVVHAARNLGSEVRFHLAWDALLTPEMYALTFDPNAPIADFLERVPVAERALRPKNRYFIGSYKLNATDFAIYKRSRLAGWRVPPHWFWNLRVAWHGRRPLPISFAKPDWPSGRALAAARIESERFRTPAN